ncbi:hypothetical protein [Martelella sp. AMO21009]
MMINTAKDYALPPFSKATDNAIPGEKTFYARFEPYYDRIRLYNRRSHGSAKRSMAMTQHC